MKKPLVDKSGWNFAIINGSLAEVFFERRGKVVIFQGFCYVKRLEYKTKKEQRWIDKDTEEVKLKYVKGEYFWLNKPEWAIVETCKIGE